MPPKHKQPALSQLAIKRINEAVDEVFDKAQVRLLGPSSLPKRLHLVYNPHYSLPGLFASAAKEEGVAPNLDTLHQLLQIAGSYINAQREKTKARVVQEVGAFLSEAHRSGVKTDLPTVLGGKLSEVWSETANHVRRIVDTEASHVRNVGVLEGIIRVNAASGVEDPTVYFIVVKDKDLCEECTRLHLLSDKVTPRVYKLSQIGSGYHSKGDFYPKMSGLHPHCRCSLTTLIPGYGFNSSGLVVFKARDHDEYESQGTK